LVEELVNVVRPYVVQTNIGNVYDFNECIGTGAAGKVFLSVNKKTNNQVAIKVMKIDKMDYNSPKLKNLVSEIKVHWALRECSGILQLQEIFEDEIFVFLVLDYQPSGNLFS
jgi:serine/threonine protein kinase